MKDQIAIVLDVLDDWSTIPTVEDWDQPPDQLDDLMNEWHSRLEKEVKRLEVIIYEKLGE